MPIVVNVSIVSKLEMKMNDEEMVVVSKEQIDFLLLQANIQLLQRVDNLVNLIETEIANTQK